VSGVRVGERLLREKHPIVVAAPSDSDALDRLRAIEAKLTQEDRPGIQSLCEELRAGQEEANRSLSEGLARVREERLPERLRLLAAEVRA